MSERNIWQRVAAVAREVTYVRKDKNVEGYMAVTHDQVTGVLRGAMLKHGIGVAASAVGSGASTVVGSTKRGATIIRHENLFAVSFVNIDNPADRIDLQQEAHANDHGDKAPGKALSYAVKSAMLKTFMLETGEGDESRYQDDELAAQLAPKPELPPGSDPDLQAWYDGNSAKVDAEYISTVVELWPSVKVIKDGIATDEMSAASEAWFEMTNEEKQQIWRAPTKGGVFTTAERSIMKSTEFREAHQVEPA